MSNTQSIAQTPADGDSKIWACPNRCGYHIADGPIEDGDMPTSELITEHLEYECPQRTWRAVLTELVRLMVDGGLATPDSVRLCTEDCDGHPLASMDGLTIGEAIAWADQLGGREEFPLRGTYDDERPFESHHVRFNGWVIIVTGADPAIVHLPRSAEVEQAEAASRRTIAARSRTVITAHVPAADPIVTRHGEHLIRAEYLGRRSDAVLGAYGWNICWRDRHRHLQWMSTPSRERAEQAVFLAVTAGAA